MLKKSFFRVGLFILFMGNLLAFETPPSVPNLVDSLESPPVIPVIILNEEVQQEEIIELYVATFGRAPDKAGLDYWLQEMKNNNWTMEKVATSFFDQDETKNQYPDSLSTDEFIDKIYLNILNRESDSAGKDYWRGELDSGKIPKQKFIIAIINGAKDKEGDDKRLLENKTTISKYFAITLSKNDPNEAKDILENITIDSQSVEDVKSWLK